MRKPATRPTLSVVPSASALPRPPDALALLGALPMPLLAIDNRNRVRYVNPAAEEFLGISASQLATLGLMDLLPADNPLFLMIDQARRDEMIVADRDLSIEGPRVRKVGISVQVAPLPEEPGTVILLMQDASTARALDRQLTFRSAARSVSGMAAILAHEVKNPLSGIRGAAQLLETSVAVADRELAVLIRDEADRIRALVDRMEMFGDKPIERGAVNIHRVLEHVRRLAQSGFAARIRFAEVYDPSLPPVWGNRDQLVQVVLNLIKNAAEAIASAGTEHGEIVLMTSYEHGVWLTVPSSERRVHLPLVVAVRDNGPGVPDDIKPHLFEPFVSGKPSGSGLGLALVAKIVGDHGGLIEVESRPSRTEVRLHLPVVPDEDGEAAV